MEAPSALSSHNPLYFASRPEARSEMSRPAASRLLYISNWKLNSETTCQEPRLRKLLGHISVYDRTRTIVRPQPQPVQKHVEDSDMQTYLQQQVPSFQEFQAAIAQQLATISSIAEAAARLAVDEYHSEEEEDDSEYDSFDGEDWSDDEAAADSEESLTDVECLDSRSECSSPTSSCGGDLNDDDDEEEGLWAVRPPSPFWKPAVSGPKESRSIALTQRRG